MAVSEATRKDVLERDRHECQLFHKEAFQASEAAHAEKHQGMGGRPPDAPENDPPKLISACSECHRKLHGPRVYYHIVAWDPENGILEVENRQGRRVSPESLWFHIKRQEPQAQLAMAETEGLAHNIRLSRWKMAGHLAYLKDYEGLLGEDIYQFGLQCGLSSADVKRLIRVHKWKEEMELPGLKQLDPVVVDKLRKVPKADLEQALAQAKALAAPDLMAWIHDKYGGSRDKTFWLFTGGYRRVQAESEDEVEAAPEERVVRGGSLIRGATWEEEGESEA